MFLRRISFFVFVFTMLTVSPTLAHEFIVKPATSAVAVGETLPFVVSSSHVFMQSEELEDAQDVQVTILDAADAPLVLAADEKDAVYKGEAVFTKPGATYLVGHRLAQTWSKTPEGMKKGGKEAHPDAPFANVYEKFAKALIIVGEADDGWRRPVGQLLEIAPQADPAGYRAGQEFPFQILYDGEPLSTEVFATCDGIATTPNSYAWYTESNDEGVAKIRFSQPGLWMVRVQHKVPGQDGVKEHVLRSVLVFPVQ